MSARLPYHRLEFAEVEAEQFKEVLDRSDIEHTIVPGRRGRAGVEQWRGPDFSLDRGDYAFPVVARGHFAPGCLCLGMARGENKPTRVNGSTVGRGNLLIFGEGAEVFYHAGPAGQWAGLTVTRETLQVAALKRLGRELRLPGPGRVRHLQTEAAAYDRILGGIRMLRVGAELPGLPIDGEAAGERLLGACVEAIAGTDPAVAGAARKRAELRQEIMLRADAAMRRLVGQPYSSAKFCEGLGVSERTLELHFRESLGVRPKAWFQILSLNRAHAMLRCQAEVGGNVTRVALACGFEHFGRFSESYRRLFGECPSGTLQTGSPGMAAG